MMASCVTLKRSDVYFSNHVWSHSLAREQAIAENKAFYKMHDSPMIHSVDFTAPHPVCAVDELLKECEA